MPGISHTETEILSQPEAWEQALEVCASEATLLEGLFKRAPGEVIFTGCGSTYYLSQAAAALYQTLTGQPARAVPAGDLLLNPQAYQARDASTLLVAVSRSGTTTETLRAVQSFRVRAADPVLVITNYGSSPLAELSDLTLAVSKGQEQSTAQTRSFASMYVAACGMSALAAGRKDLLEAMGGLPAAGKRLIQQYGPAAQALGADLSFNRFYYLGSGTLYGLACEVNLKMKEMSLTDSEAFHFLEFRHGPMSMVSPQTMIAGLLSETNRTHEQQVLDEMQALGGRVFSLAESQADVNFDSRLPEAVRGVLYLPALQLMALGRALAKGLDPDRPHNLSSVIQLNTL